MNEFQQLAAGCFPEDGQPHDVIALLAGAEDRAHTIGWRSVKNG
jgi:hypothetical protein